MVKDEPGSNEGSHRIAAADDGTLEPEQFRKIFIGGLHSSTDEDSMKNFYGQFGEVIDCVVMKDPTTKRSRGFGFVSFTNMLEVDKAMEARPHEIDGKVVDPKRAVPREDSARGQKLPSTSRLYVSGVRDGHTEEMFKEYFSQFGTVEKVEIMIDKITGKPRGFGFVTFDDYDAVDKCVLKKSHTINDHRCDCKKGLSKEEMNKAAQGERDRAGRFDRSRGMDRGGAPGGGWGAGGGGDRGGWGAGSGWGSGPAAGGGWGAGGGGGGYGAPQAAGGGWGAPRAGGYDQGGWGQQGAGGYGAPAGGYGGGGAGGYGASARGAPAQSSRSAGGGYGGSYGGGQPQSGGWGAAPAADPWRRNY